ncbi:hypothetical protein SK355_06275 [Candidatus Fukatsuia symbiotica]|uniref:Uncharacterized protein n=1 Tax=Candidatus Fukatsuia symbiotica TaxID=1878942 RepID=A0A2U8I934_9GAMM|nr:hypothetical protein [Candidatus Fukatsuia symbiotica]AWK14585.1 hypothetical protein CCS41_09020 [Candidatus Fukatsuia symbiotica]MEA9444883.1 hypothetical protein [Candidatus Fukatsuia symbiotica]
MIESIGGVFYDSGSVSSNESKPPLRLRDRIKTLMDDLDKNATRPDDFDARSQGLKEAFYRFESDYKKSAIDSAKESYREPQRIRILRQSFKEKVISEAKLDDRLKAQDAAKDDDKIMESFGFKTLYKPWMSEIMTSSTAPSNEEDWGSKDEEEW